MRKRLTHEERVFGLALLAGLPGVLVALCLLWWAPAVPLGPESVSTVLRPEQARSAPPYNRRTQWTVSVLMLGFWFGCAYAVRTKVRFPLRTLSNLLAAIREGDSPTPKCRPSPRR